MLVFGCVPSLVGKQGIHRVAEYVSAVSFKIQTGKRGLSDPTKNVCYSQKDSLLFFPCIFGLEKINVHLKQSVELNQMMP